ncbi:MAG: LptF/LptG family permease [Deltaproteobacteria bacterium]|nr:LptF/LptG family permease [Deltaproteobacteria bacterium]
MRVGRYLVAIVLARSAAALVLLVAVYAAVDVVETSQSFGMEATKAFASYPLRLPTAIVQALPLALLVGVLLALASLRKRGEWDALASAGISPARLAPWLLLAPFAGALLSAPLSRELVPRCLERWQAAAGPTTRAFSEESLWTKAGRALVRCDGGPGCREGVIIERGDKGLPLVFSTPSGDGARQVWRTGRGWRNEVSRESLRGIADASRFPVAGGLFVGAGLPSGRLAAAITAQKAAGRDTAPLEAEQGLRSALALSCLVLPILGLALGLTARRLEEVGLIALGLAAAFAYWFVLAATWNGAVLGLWSSEWVGSGVPALFVLLSAVIAMGCGPRCCQAT